MQSRRGARRAEKLRLRKLTNRRVYLNLTCHMRLRNSRIAGEFVDPVMRPVEMMQKPNTCVAILQRQAR